MVSPVSGPTVDVPPLPPLTSLSGPVAPEVEVTVAVVLEPEVALPVLPELSVPLPPTGRRRRFDRRRPGGASTTIASPTARRLRLSTPPGRPAANRAGPRRPRAGTELGCAPAADDDHVAASAGPGSRASSKPATRQHSARPAPPRRARGSLSLFDEPRTSQAAGQGTSSGLVPSAPVVVVAALTGFFLLVAPRVGRRIRVARELSPRGTYRSSIDHPG